MNALVEVGFEVNWKSGSIEIKREEETLEVQMINGLPMLDDEKCLMLIDEIEDVRRMKVKTLRAERLEEETGFRISSIWQPLKKLLIWLMKNDIAKGVELLKLCIIRRRNEVLEEERKIMEQKALMLEQVKGREAFQEKVILFEVCCNEGSKLSSHMRERGAMQPVVHLAKSECQGNRRISRRPRCTKSRVIGND